MVPYNFLSTTKDLPHPTIGIYGKCLWHKQRGGSFQYSRLSSAANLRRGGESSKNTNLQSTPYSSIERSLDSPVDFQRSTLAYILPMKPLQPERYLQKSQVSKKPMMPPKEIPVVSHLTAQSRSTDQSTNFGSSPSGACLAFFETGSKELLPSTISHWWRDTPEWGVSTDKESYSLSGSQGGSVPKVVPPKGVPHTVSTSDMTVTLPVSKHDAISSFRPVRSAHGSKSFIDGATLSKGTFHNQESPKISESLRSHDRYLTYSTVNTHTNSWNWLIWNFERHQVITGRISRPIQRAGFCVLLGGFPVFLPYGQFLCRQTWTHKKEGQLQSFQMSAFAPKGSAYSLPSKGVPHQSGSTVDADFIRGKQFPAYNCVVSRDQFIRRIAQHVSIHSRNVYYSSDR
jgi:hypothetical protein